MEGKSVKVYTHELSIEGILGTMVHEVRCKIMRGRGSYEMLSSAMIKI